MGSYMPSDSGQTFVFADLAGFTALTEVHGDAQAADLAEDFCGRTAALADDHGAETVKTIGDAVLLRTADAGSSIVLGIGIVREMSEVEGYPAIRVGMHSGPAVARGGDWYGATVNLAARIAGVAAGGEVVLSGATREVAGSIDAVDFETLGERRFKNVTEAVALFRVRHRAEARGRLDIDPVCRMAIAAGRGAGSLTHGGEKYRFCSLACAATFASAPDRYAVAPAHGGD